MSEYETVGAIARTLSEQLAVVVRPHDISDLIYKRRLSEDRCPLLGGRRLIPRDLIPEIERELRERGRVPRKSKEATT